jgi:hypothetical protein
MGQLSYAEKQEFMLKNKISALKELREDIKKEMIKYPDAVRVKVLRAVNNKIAEYEFELTSLYSQLKLFN